MSCQPNISNNYGERGQRYHYSSLPIPLKGLSYSNVQGEAFFNAIVCGMSLEIGHTSGVSPPHGLPDNRSHIWTFAVACVDDDPN